MYTRLVLFSLAGFALWALGRNRPDPQGRVPETAVDVHGAYANDVEKTRAREKSSYSKRRLATSLTFATLFFAGAALSAGAGDTVAEMVEGTDAPAAAETTTAEAPAEEAPPAEAPPAPEAPAEEPAEAPAEEPAEAPAEQPAEAPADEPAAGGSEGEEAPADDPGQAVEGEEPAAGEPAEGSEGSEEPADEPEEEPAPAPKDDEPAESSDSGTEAATEGSPELPATAPAETSRELEFESGFATIWLHRTLPDPTPQAKRLTPKFARQLRLTSERMNVDWAFLLGVLRAQRHLDREPVSQASLNRLARQLRTALRGSDAWQAALAMGGRTAFADRTMAWTHYHRAVGLRALVSGLAAAKSALEDRVLFDPRIDMYAGGASDVASGRIDVRVLVLLRYMAEAHGQVTVSSLKSGHGFFARPGVPSAHMYGLAVDISGLEGQSITGNQEPGGLTERAVRNILWLPRELRPKQVISLLGLGGPSFPLEDHHDHIHVGY